MMGGGGGIGAFIGKFQILNEVIGVFKEGFISTTM